MFKKSKLMSSLLLDAAGLLNESILDPVNSTRCGEIFDNNEIMKTNVSDFIEKTFTLFYEQLNSDLKTFNVKGYKAIGSSTGFQYTDSSDLDIQVMIEMLPGHDFSETRQIISILPNGNNVPGTNHPVNYFLVDVENPTELHKVENLYNINTKKWEKQTDASQLNIPILYVREISRFFTDAFDLLLGRYDRDVQYLKDTVKLNPATQDISEAEKSDAIDKALTTLKADIDSMRLADKLIHGFRLQAYDNNNFFHISINYMDDEDPRKSMNEAIYKTLDKFQYREKLWERIDAGNQLISEYE